MPSDVAAAKQPKPALAVCLAAFNGRQHLPEQLASICDGRQLSSVVYVSVDRSTDGTEDWITKRAAAEPQLQVLPHGLHFGGAARNFFRLLRDVNFSSYDYIAFADQDDIWEPNKLARAVQVLGDTGAHGYSSNVTAFWPDGRQRLIQKAQAQVQWDHLFEAAGPGCTYVMRRELAQALQQRVRAQWEQIQAVELHDWFTYAFARTNGFRWFIDDFSGLKYRQHSNNQVGVNMGLRAFWHRAKKVLRGDAIAQARLVARLVGQGEHPFVQRWSEKNGRLGVLWLALQASRCRRRRRDQWLFALACTASALLGWQK